ncbi:hypothetical protein CFOL_v3_16670 [Cephalotus follicularis]|uniref:RING-type domain-containing protein n=1 Tax=Cephalotus follicularis TaxID=3775 RepID=A0A1Q3BZJ1_CEPFO|nr:hypothetical protein CFOL_v3_16670 [Cephalotus follicularis]
MDSGSIYNPPLLSLSKKKKTNRLTKLKQSKLDVRREQWLSHVQNKGHKVDSNGMGASPPTCVLVANKGNGPLDCLKVKSGREDNDGSSIHDSYLDSLRNSPNGSSDDSRKSTSRSISSSSSSDFCSVSVSEKEENDGCPDDWEAVADALNVDDNQNIAILNSPSNFETRIGSAGPQSNKNVGVDLSKSESRGTVMGSRTNCQAWMRDDAFRPQSLPSLPKQNSDWHCVHVAATGAWENIISLPSSCPICCEDFDLTDSCFLPCLCGFRLCLFCHKRILEADARCPGCRKGYDTITENMGFNDAVAPFRFAQSCTMTTSL